MNPIDVTRYLPLLSADDGTQAAGNGADDSDATATDAGTPGGKQGGTESQEQESKPFAVFPDSDTFNARIDREANARLKAQAVEHGFDSTDAMMAAIKAQREREDAEKTELQRVQDQLQQLESQSTAAVARANEFAVRTKALEVAAELGIRQDRMNHALRLADLGDVAVDDEFNADAGAVKAALQAVVDDMPELTANQHHAPRNSTDHGASTNETTPDMNSWIRKAAGRA